MEWLAKAAPQEHGQGGPAIFPRIKLLGYTWLVADRNFKDLIAGLENAGSDFRLNLETATLHR